MRKAVKSPPRPAIPNKSPAPIKKQPTMAEPSPLIQDELRLPADKRKHRISIVSSPNMQNIIVYEKQRTVPEEQERFNSDQLMAVFEICKTINANVQENQRKLFLMVRAAMREEPMIIQKRTKQVQSIKLKLIFNLWRDICKPKLGIKAKLKKQYEQKVASVIEKRVKNNEEQQAQIKISKFCVDSPPKHISSENTERNPPQAVIQSIEIQQKQQPQQQQQAQHSTQQTSQPTGILKSYDSVPQAVTPDKFKNISALDRINSFLFESQEKKNSISPITQKVVVSPKVKPASPQRQMNVRSPQNKDKPTIGKTMTSPQNGQKNKVKK